MKCFILTMQIICLASLLAFDSQGAIAQLATFQELATLGGDYSWGNNISSDGSTVIGESSNASGDTFATIWTDANTATNLDTLGGTYSYAISVSANGSTVVGTIWMRVT